jgi:hypothetical protein
MENCVGRYQSHGHNADPSGHLEHMYTADMLSCVDLSTLTCNRELNVAIQSSSSKQWMSAPLRRYDVQPGGVP